MVFSVFCCELLMNVWPFWGLTKVFFGKYWFIFSRFLKQILVSLEFHRISHPSVLVFALPRFWRFWFGPLLFVLGDFSKSMSR